MSERQAVPAASASRPPRQAPRDFIEDNPMQAVHLEQIGRGPQGNPLRFKAIDVAVDVPSGTAARAVKDIGWRWASERFGALHRRAERFVTWVQAPSSVITRSSVAPRRNAKIGWYSGAL